MWVCHPDSGFPGEVLGELEFQPFLPPFPSPRERDPSPGWLPHSLPSGCLGCIWACRAPAWCGPALTEQLGRGLGSMRGELALVAGVDLWPVTCGLPAPPGSPSFSLPNEVSASLSVGQMAQPRKLMDTHFPSLWTLGPCYPSHRVPERPHGSPASSPRAKVLGTELLPPLGLSSCPAHCSLPSLL